MSHLDKPTQCTWDGNVLMSFTVGEFHTLKINDEHPVGHPYRYSLCLNNAGEEPRHVRYLNKHEIAFVHGALNAGYQWATRGFEV